MNAGRAFLDTNVLVYAVDEGEPEKQAVARDLLRTAVDNEFVLSTQVLSEFYVVVTRKLEVPLPEEVAAQAVDMLGTLAVVPADANLVKAAIRVGRSSQISYWDALVVAAAEAAGCERLLSEDLGDGQSIGEVRVENPFRARGRPLTAPS